MIKALPNRIRAFRERAGLSMQALAERAGTSAPQINKLEKGDRTWTAPQLAEWIEQQFGVRVSAAHLRRFRRRWQLSWKRTARSVNHKQKPDEVAAKKKELDALEKRGSRA